MIVNLMNLYLMNLYVMNNMVNYILADKSFLSPLIPRTKLRDELDIK